MKRSMLRRFAADDAGVAAVEFILVFPVLLLLLLGSFEITQATIAHKKTQKVAYTIDNLLTKAPTLTAKVVQKSLEAATYVIKPLDASQIAIKVTYRYFDSAGKISETWSESFSPNGKSPDDAPLPEGYASLRDVGYLSTQVQYKHKAVFPSLFFAERIMGAQSVVRPRPGKSLSCSDC